MRPARKAKTARSQSLRREATAPENKLWQRLRNRQLAGLKFVRQEAVGPFFADFVCREKKLIVEIDGGQHSENERDAVRTRWLLSKGYRVVRFWNNEVEQNIDGVLERLHAVLAELAPHPDR